MRRAWPAIFILIALAIIGLIYWRRREWSEHSQDVPILTAARRYNVEPALVKAVVWRESRFDPTQRGRAGEYGLMQIRDAAASDYAAAERIPNFSPRLLYNPATNTLVGTWYLARLLKRYPLTDDPVPYALADYNAGHGNTIKWTNGPAATNSAAFLEQITFPGTKSYIHSVIERRDYYRPIFPPKEPPK